MKTPEVTSIPVGEIRFFVQRAREKSGFEALKESMKEHGLKQPIEVRSIEDLPPAERKRPGGHYKYELTVGQGRLTAARELGWKTIPALLVKSTDQQTVGRFLSENLIRKPQPWAMRGRQIKQLIDAGESLESVAKSLAITENHARKYLRMVSKPAEKLAEEVAAMPMNDAESFTTIPESHQLIVMAAIKEAKAEKEIRAVVARAKRLMSEGKEVTVTTLLKEMEFVKHELVRMHDLLKLKRWHHALGPDNLIELLKIPAMVKGLKKANVHLEKFQSLTAEA